MNSRPPEERSFVVGVAGGSASGKSGVVRELVRLLEPTRAAVVPHDAYYYDVSHLPFEQRLSHNFDHPDALETRRLIRDLKRLRNGLPIDVPVYDFVSNARAAETRVVQSAPVIIVEGILVLHEPGLRAQMDLCVFVDVEEEERLARRLHRDVDERGRSRSSVLAQHHGSVQPMHDRFVEPSRHHADVVIREGFQNLTAMKALRRRVEDARTP